MEELAVIVTCDKPKLKIQHAWDLIKEYFNRLTGKCQNQLLGDQPCSQIDACRNDIGLSCQNSVCKCTTANSYWNGTSCAKVLSYNQGTCSKDSECNGNLVCKTSGVKISKYFLT